MEYPKYNPKWQSVSLGEHSSVKINLQLQYNLWYQ